MDTSPTPNPESHSVPWSLRETWFAVFYLFLWIGGVTFVVVLVTFLGYVIDPGLLLNVGELLLLLPVFWLMGKYNIGLDVFGLRRFHGRVLNLGCGYLFLIYLVVILYSLALSFFGISTSVDLAPLLEEIGSPVPLLIATVIAAPFVEELFFRGVLFFGLRQRFGWVWAAVISTALFAILHLQLTNLLPIFLIGFLFAYITHIGNSIWPSIILHALFNAFNVILLYISIENGLP